MSEPLEFKISENMDPVRVLTFPEGWFRADGTWDPNGFLEGSLMVVRRKGLDVLLEPITEDAIRAVERERCARIADGCIGMDLDTAEHIAARIRAGEGT